MDNNNMMYNGYEQPAEKKTSVKAILSLVFGILALLTCCYYGVPGIILGIVGVVLANLSKKDTDGKRSGLALAGMICSIIAIVAGAIYLILIIVGVGAVLSDPSLMNQYM